MGVTIQENDHGSVDFAMVLGFLKANRVLIGIPQASGGHGNVTNAELAYIHSKGSPRLHIPARPFLEPAIEQAKDQIADKMKAAAEMAVAGDIGAAMTALNEAGQYGENATKEYMSGGHFAPNAPITVEGGWMRNRISNKPFKVKGKGSSQPLMDTGSLRSSITHVIESK